MNISYNWLKDYLDFNLSPEEAGERLTQTGLEVEAIEKFESVKGGLEGLTIGLVTAVEKHPDADKLSVTKVDVGTGDQLQIVCGASNVATGQKVIVAQEGTLLHPFSGESFKIKKTKIRGVASEGMICAEDEIGLSEDHTGIMVLEDSAPIGIAAKEYLKISSDYIIQIGLTPNRGDAMSHIGVARDLAASLSASQNENLSLKIPSVENFLVSNHALPIEVVVENTEACLRFSGLTISGITVKESPEWLKNKLKAIGLRPINNIVDITNFVMNECGQPLHAYDATQIAGGRIVVKTVDHGTAFRTLDDKEIKLRNTDLMVCSGSEKSNDVPLPMCIAGVYGGLKSGVKDATTSIFLEAACWNPTWIRRTATFHNLRTDAASRFEKGVDPNGNIYALKRAALLISELAGGMVSSDIVDVYPVPVSGRQITLTWEKLHRIAGIEIPKPIAIHILKAISFEIIAEDDLQITVAAPTFKTDVLRSEDVIEEILRIYGFDKIPVPDAIRSSLSFNTDDKKESLTEELSQLLAASGFREMMNNSISNSKYHEAHFPASKDSVVRLLSYSNIGLDSLRTSMLFPALEVIRYNHNRKLFDLKLFEFGKTYLKKEEGYQENSHLVVLITGQLTPESWKEQQKPVDHFFLKGMMEKILKKCGINKYTETAFSDAIWEQGVTYRVGKTDLLSFGKVNEQVVNSSDIKREVFYAAIDMDALLKFSKNTVKFSPLPKFPFVRRDLALVIDSNISFSDIEQIAYKSSGNLLKEVNLFDVYADEKLGAGKKSYAVSFIFLDEQRTLTDADVDKVIEKMIQQFQSQLNANIRN
ncbi:MAG TPA: phenylalanine--tRNA ligase subunit beta [Chitinophagales bacterium]|nr:phenylalanine--tRNA ligase subunit beta [Chitinophagales bacterium]